MNHWVTFRHGFKDFGCGLIVDKTSSTARVRVLLGGRVHSGDHQVVNLAQISLHKNLEDARTAYLKIKSADCLIGG